MAKLRLEKNSGSPNIILSSFVAIVSIVAIIVLVMIGLA